MARKSTISRPPSEPKDSESPCPREETFSQALARLRSETKAEVSPLLLDYLNRAAAQEGAKLLYKTVTHPQRGLRLLPLSEDLPPLP